MPIAGRPEALLASADALTRSAEGLEVTTGDLGPALRAAVAGWRGAAAARADERFRGDLDALRRASQACQTIAEVLRAHADLLARAQRDAADGEQLAVTDPTTGARVVESAELGLAVAAEDAARVVRDAAALLPAPVDAERGDLIDGLSKAGGDLAEELVGVLDHVNPFSDRFGAAWSQTGATVAAVATTNPVTTLGAVLDDVTAPIAESYRTGGADEAAGRGAGAIAAALLGGKGLTKLGKLAPEAPPTPSGDPPAQSMRRVPGGGLRGHDRLGGHSYAPEKAHIGRSDREMVQRLEREPKRKRVSSYTNWLVAERAAHDNLRGNAAAIDEWLHDPTKVRPRGFGWEHDGFVGRTAQRDGTVADTMTSTIVLAKDSRAPLGYFVLSSYPGR